MGVAVPSRVLPVGHVGPVAVDTETSGLYVDDGARVAVVSVAWLDEANVSGMADEYGIVTVAFPFDQGPRDKIAVLQQDLFDQGDPNLEREEWEYLLGWLDRPGMRLVFHNAKFDLMMLAAGTRHWPGVDLVGRFWWDTQIACKDIWPTDSTSLKPTSVRLWGEGEDDEQQAVKTWLRKNRLTMGDADKVPWSIIEGYAAKDTALTLRLYLRQIEEVEQGAARHSLIQSRFDLTRTLYRIEQRGLGFDASGCLDAAALLQDRVQVAAQALPFEPGPTEAKAYFFGDQVNSRGVAGLGLAPIKETEKGATSIDDEVLHTLVKRGIAGAAEYQQWAKMTRALSMWYLGYPAMIGPDGRLRTCFRQAHVKSNRMSVERVNLQAIPKDDKAINGVPSIRSFVQAAPGMELWNLDLSQAELRVASQYAGCRKMLAMLLEGADLHTITTETVLRVPKSAPDFKYHRDIGKRLTFGSIFQIGPKSFQQQLREKAHIEMALEPCKRIVYGWRNEYPEFGWAYDRYQSVAESNGYVTLLPGTKYEVRSWFGERDWPNTAWSRMVQGSLAEFVAMWLVATDRICTQMGYPDALVLTVHDSVVLELPEGEGEPVVAAVKDWAERAATRLFGIEMKVDTGGWHK